jgi:hypothetical protein
MAVGICSAPGRPHRTRAGGAAYRKTGWKRFLDMPYRFQNGAAHARADHPREIGYWSLMNKNGPIEGSKTGHLPFVLKDGSKWYAHVLSTFSRRRPPTEAALPGLPGAERESRQRCDRAR